MDLPAYVIEDNWFELICMACSCRCSGGTNQFDTILLIWAFSASFSHSSCVSAPFIQWGRGCLPVLRSGQRPELTGRGWRTQGGRAGLRLCKGLWVGLSVGGVLYESRWGQGAWIGVAGKLGWEGPGCTPQCFCALSHPCVCMCVGRWRRRWVV